ANHCPDVTVVRALLEFDLLPVERVDDDGVGRIAAAPDVRDRAANDVDQGVIRYRPRRLDRRVLDDTEEVLAGAVTVEDLLLLVLAEVIDQLGVDNVGETRVVGEVIVVDGDPDGVRPNRLRHRIQLHRGLRLGRALGNGRRRAGV